MFQNCCLFDTCEHPREVWWSLLSSRIKMGSSTGLRSVSGITRLSTLIFLSLFCFNFGVTEAYDALDPNGNITIKWDIKEWTPDGYNAVVTIFNYQQYRHIQAPGWTLGWAWAKKEVIWNMVGGQTTEQGDCSRFKGNIPHCCKKDPKVVDLLPGTPYNLQIANCCKGGVISSWGQDPANAASSFLVTVGQAGTTNKTVRVPKNFTLKAPGPGYTCGRAMIVKPSKFISQDGRRTTQALSSLDTAEPELGVNEELQYEESAQLEVFDDAGDQS